HEWQMIFFAEFLILSTAARCDVNQSGALGLTDRAPSDDAMRLRRCLAAAGVSIGEQATRLILRRKRIERTGVLQPEQVGSLPLAKHFESAATLQNGADGLELVRLMLAL